MATSVWVRDMSLTGDVRKFLGCVIHYKLQTTQPIQWREFKSKFQLKEISASMTVYHKILGQLTSLNAVSYVSF